MALADLMNADMATVGGWLRGGWTWWTGELAAMAPGLARAPGSGLPVAVMGPGGPVFERGGRRLAAAPRGAVRLALPADAILARALVLPRLGRADTRRLLALDLERLTPLPAGTALFDHEVLAGEAPPGRQRVRLVVVARAAAAAVLARARAAGLEVAALGEATGAIDVLPELDGVGAAPWWARARAWWAIAGALLLLNLGVAIGRDRADVERLRAVTDAQGDAVAVAQRARAGVRREVRAREAWAARRAAGEPLRVLAAATRALPREAWAQRYEWDGARVRLGGFARAGFDTVAAFRRSPEFVGVRTGTPEGTTLTPATEPFDLTAEPRR